MKSINCILKTFIFSLAIFMVSPQPASAFSKTHQMKKAEATPPSVKTDKGAVKAPESGLKEIVTFNEGWRWVYRKKVTSLLRDEIYADDQLLKEVFLKFGISAVDKENAVKEAKSVAESLKENGFLIKAEYLKEIIQFFEDPKDPLALDAVLREDPEGEFEKLGLFLLANHYEVKGFYPEAAAYYSKLLADRKDPSFLAAAEFGRARVLFHEGKLNAAKELFQSSFERGFAASRLWLANTALVKGEFDLSWKLYDGGKKPFREIDSINLLSIGDMLVIRGRFNEARQAYEVLRSRYPKDELLSTFFVSKTGDSYLAEGGKEEAIKIYLRTKGMLEGDPWAMAALSLADAYRADASKESLLKAEKIYSLVAEGQYLGSEVSHLSHISTLIKLNKFEEGMERVLEFPGRYPTSLLKADISRLQGLLAHKWIDSLYSQGDYYGVVNAASKYGGAVPFGKKAESFLKAGKAYYSLGLYPDAVKSLERSIKIGSSDTAEEAFVTLAGVYLGQSDTGSAERLLNAFAARFPKTRYKNEVEAIAFKIAFAKGDYTKASQMRTPDGPEFNLLKAKAFSKLGRNNEAALSYAKAVKGLEAKHDEALLSKAYAGLADSNFMAGKYQEAIEAYRHLLSGESREDRAWALYRTAESHSRLGNDGERQKALKDLKGLNTELSGWAGVVSKKPASL